MRYVEDLHGREALVEALIGTGLDRKDFEQGAWASLPQVERFLANSRELFSDDESFKRAFGYRLADTLGPVRYLAWATSPSVLFTRGFQSIDAFSDFSRVEIVHTDRSSASLHYFSARPESRLLCLSRQGQAAALPTLWDLPPAVFHERSCIARGDDRCDYLIRWYESRRWWPPALGVVLGGASLAAAWHLDAGDPTAGWLLLPAVLGLLGYAYELRRTQRAHVTVAQEASEALRALAKQESEARRELWKMHERQRQWSRLLEEQVAERTASVHRALATLDARRREQEVAMRGVSHDLRNPLAALGALSWQLRGCVEGDLAPSAELLEDYEEALSQLESLVDELVTSTRGEQLVSLRPIAQEIHDLPDRLRRRLSALVFGKDVRVTVFRTREAPERIHVDPLLFDRVMDNLMTNAAKYTERGSIVLEVGGTPGHLTLKLSDTGIGIEQERIEQIFSGHGAPPRDATGRSFGVGLSVVVRLMAQLGGRLEVMSKPGEGTTFWAHFPVDAVEACSGEEPAPSDFDAVVRRVVNIRRVH